MMSNFVVYPLNAKRETEVLHNISSQMGHINSALEDVKTVVRKNMSHYPQISLSIEHSINDINAEKQRVSAMGTALGTIMQKYIDTENAVCDNKEGWEGIKAREAAVFATVHGEAHPQNGKNTVTKGDSLENKFKEEYKKNFKDDLRNAIIESSGETLVKAGGGINVATALARSGGENGFIIVNPAVSKHTSKMISTGSKIAKGAKYGLPLLGAAIDFVSLKHDGKSTGEALVKSGAHLAIGVAGGKAGAAIGAAIGSVIPGAGTAVGAVVGFVGGVAITTIGNLAFDYIYDKREEIVDGVVNGINNVGKKINRFFKGLGAVFA